MQTAYLLKEEKIQEVLPGFLATLITHLDGLQQPVATGNLPELGKAGHRLKGALLNLGLTELAEIAYTIEQQSSAENQATDYQELMQTLQEKISTFTSR